MLRGIRSLLVSGPKPLGFRPLSFGFRLLSQLNVGIGQQSVRFGHLGLKSSRFLQLRHGRRRVSRKQQSRSQKQVGGVGVRLFFERQVVLLDLPLACRCGRGGPHAQEGHRFRQFGRRRREILNLH